MNNIKIFRKSLSNKLQKNYLLLKWIILCSFTSRFLLKVFLHISQTNGLSFVWIILWYFKSSFVLKPLSHISQTNGLSFVWIFLCVFKCWFTLKALSHKSQTYSFFLSWIISFCFNIWFFLKDLSIKWHYSVLHYPQNDGPTLVWFKPWRHIAMSNQYHNHSFAFESSLWHL